MDKLRFRRLKFKYHQRNVLNITLIEACWGMGMAFFVIDAITNVFLKDLGANYFVLGIIPAFWALGGFIPPVLAAYFTQSLRKKKRLLIIWHYIPPTFVLACGLFIYIGAKYLHTSLLITTTVFFMSGYWLFMGFLMPVYVNFIQKVLDTSRRGLAFGSIFAAQCTFGALGVYFASLLLSGAEAHGGNVAVMERYGLCFIIGAVIIFFGNLFFFPIKELEDIEIEEPLGIKKYLASFIKIFREEKNLRNYTIARYFILSYLAFLYFYPSYVKGSLYAGSIRAEELAMFALFSFVGQAIGYFGVGLLSTKLGYKLIALIGNVVLIGNIIIFLSASTLFEFYIIATLIGAFIGIERYYNMNLVIEICKQEDKTKFLVLATLLQAPAMAFVVLVGGLLSDVVGFKNVVIASGVLMVFGTIMLQFMVHLQKPVRVSKNAPETKQGR